VDLLEYHDFNNILILLLLRIIVYTNTYVILLSITHTNIDPNTDPVILVELFHIKILIFFNPFKSDLNPEFTLWIIGEYLITQTQLWVTNHRLSYDNTIILIIINY